MDDLKQSVQNAVYEQKDPLLIYKFESFNLFKSLIDNVNKTIVSFLLKASLPQQVSTSRENIQRNINLQTSRPEEVARANTPQKSEKNTTYKSRKSNWKK